MCESEKQLIKIICRFVDDFLRSDVRDSEYFFVEASSCNISFAFVTANDLSSSEVAFEFPFHLSFKLVAENVLTATRNKLLALDERDW